MKDYVVIYKNKFIDNFARGILRPFLLECNTKEEVEDTIRQMFEAIFVESDTPRLFTNALEEILEDF